MRLRLPLLLVAALFTTGCFQMTTTIKVAADGSGTIEQRQLITAAGMATRPSVRSAQAGADSTRCPRSRRAARRPGWATASHTYRRRRLPSATGQGRAITYTFTDINGVRVGFDAPAPGLLPGQDGQGVSFALTTLETDMSLLGSRYPQELFAEGGGSLPPPEQIALARSFLAGARVSIAVEPAGALVEASSPFVDGNRVTLLEIDFDQLLKDDVLARVRATKTAEELKAVVATAPGLKLNLDSPITVEFAPVK